MITDYDHLPEEDYKRIWKKLKNDKHTVLMFRSPSGDGIKAVVSIPKSSKDDYRKRFKANGDYINEPLFLDVKNSNISRLCFVSYDPELYTNWDAVPFTEINELEPYKRSERAAVLPITDEDRLVDIAIKWLNKNHPYGKGNRNNSIFQFAGSCCRIGVSKETCEYIATTQIINDDFDHSEAMASFVFNGNSDSTTTTAYSFSTINHILLS